MVVVHLHFEVADDGPLQLQGLRVNQLRWSDHAQAPQAITATEEEELVIRKDGRSITVSRRRRDRLGEAVDRIEKLERELRSAEIVTEIMGERIIQLVVALKGVVAVADRETDEFKAARVAIAKAEGRDR